MLRASVRRSTTEANLLAVVDPLIDPRLPAGSELRALADAVVMRDSEEREIAFNSLTETAGLAAAIRATAVVGNFEMMNRLLDGIGVGPTRGAARIAPELGVDWPLSQAAGR